MNVQLQKILSIFHPQKGLEFPGGGGSLRTKIERNEGWGRGGEFFILWNCTVYKNQNKSNLYKIAFSWLPFVIGIKCSPMWMQDNFRQKPQNCRNCLARALNYIVMQNERS